MESITSLNPLKYEGNAIINCYDQYPQGGDPSFYDKFCYNLNSNIEAFKDVFNPSMFILNIGYVNSIGLVSEDIPKLRICFLDLNLGIDEMLFLVYTALSSRFN